MPMKNTHNPRVLTVLSLRVAHIAFYRCVQKSAV